MTTLTPASKPDASPPFDRRRAHVLLALVFGLLGVLMVRLWYLQVALGPEIERQAERYRTKSLRQPPMRGKIIDRNGELVAKVQPQDVLVMVPAEALDQHQTIAFVARVLGESKERIYKILKAAPNRNLPTPVAVGLTPEQYVALSEERFLHPAIQITEKPIRVYPDGASFSHAVGYVGPASEADLKEFSGADFDPGDFVGKVGVERQQERILHGQPGVEAMEVDAVGRPVGASLITARPPRPGGTVMLSLDGRLQRKANELLRGRLGAVVAVEPNTGEVLALTGSPTFDANLFATRILPEDWAALRDDPNQPLLNRALQSAYPPASTFKMLTAIAALNAGQITTRSGIVCRGAYQVGKRSFRCHRTHGYVDFLDAIALSCDTFFYHAAMRTGPDRLRDTAVRAGFGVASGVDLPSERSGLVPTDEWLAKKKLTWRGGDTANLAIGQGYLLATPLQMANWAALLANRGVAYRPHLVRAVLDPMTEETLWRARPEPAFRLDTSAAAWDAIHRAMVRCIESGTGTRARIEGIRWAGKTGSAEHNKSKKTHAWFIGYAPADNPRIAVAVLLEKAGHGGEQAAPIAAELVRTYLQPPAPPPPTSVAKL